MIKLIPLTKEYLSFVLDVRNHGTTRINLEKCENWFKNLKYHWYIVLKKDGNAYRTTE